MVSTVVGLLVSVVSRCWLAGVYRWDGGSWWVGEPPGAQDVCGFVVSHGSISDVLHQHVIDVSAACVVVGVCKALAGGRGWRQVFQEVVVMAI